MGKITVERLQEVLLNHRRWVEGADGGERADLRGADLRGADLRGDLRGADLRDAVLRGAYLTGAYLTGADLRGADLTGADLRGAYLRGADLTGADLRGANGEKIVITKAPVQIANLHWFVTIWDAHMQIGCEMHSHAEWGAFDDARIDRMDAGALKFWREWKDILLAICAKHREEE